MPGRDKRGWDGNFHHRRPAVTLDPTVGITDASSTTLASATVEIASGFLAGDQLSADTTGTSITASYDSTTGVLTL